MVKWILESEQKPPYRVDVLLWNDCEPCRNKSEHYHKCHAHSWNCPNSFQKGMYCQGVKDDMYAHKYPLDMQEDYWTPGRPSHWAYVNSPFEECCDAD